MAERFAIYKCNICGNVVKVNVAGKGNLICCGQPMELQNPRTEEQGYEKHLPVVEQEGDVLKVKVGSIPHPMEPSHYIVWVEVEFDGYHLQKFLNPGESPEGEFCLSGSGKVRAVREYCNLHGLWEKRF